MDDPQTLIEGLMARLQGPMHFRLFLQPAIAMFFAFRDGRRDARDGKPAYFWAFAVDPAHRRELLVSGWKSIGKVFCIAIVLDLVFQHLAFKEFRMAGAIVAGVLLAMLPYLLLRGPVNRLLRRSKGS